MAEELHINGFQASLWLVSRFRCLFSVQRSIKLFVQAAGVCEAAHDEDMNKNRTNISKFYLDVVYNSDETGLLYAVIPSRTCLLSSEVGDRFAGLHLCSASRASLKRCVRTQAVPPSFVFVRGQVAGSALLSRRT